jgi:hypothetical protein
MRIRFLIGLIAVLGVLIAVESTWADSTVLYPDSSRSQVFNLGSGEHAFVFFDIEGDNDIFIHPVDFNANLLPVVLSNAFAGVAIWLRFEGLNGNFLQYGVFTCPSGVFSCTVSGVRRGTLFI